MNLAHRALLAAALLVFAAASVVLLVRTVPGPQPADVAATGARAPQPHERADADGDEAAVPAVTLRPGAPSAATSAPPSYDAAVEKAVARALRAERAAAQQAAADADEAAADDSHDDGDSPRSEPTDAADEPAPPLRGDQARLSQLGWYRGAVDGIPGPATRRAVRDFRAAAGLPAGDELDTAARDALHHADAPRAPQPPPRPQPEQAAGCDFRCEGAKMLDMSVLPLPDGWTVSVQPSRKGLLGMAFGDRREIEVYMRTGRSAKQMLPTLYHEIAHAWDFTVMTRPQREQWAATRGYPERVDRWFDLNGAKSDFGIPAGDFAESVSWCLEGEASDFRSQLAPRPTGDQCQLALSMLRR